MVSALPENGALVIIQGHPSLLAGLTAESTLHHKATALLANNLQQKTLELTTLFKLTQLKNKENSIILFITLQASKKAILFFFFFAVLFFPVVSPSSMS